MRITPQFKELKKYIGERNVKDTVQEFELHRCHFRITESDRKYITETAAMLKWSVTHLCNVMIEKTLPLIETALFRSEHEFDYEVILQKKRNGAGSENNAAEDNSVSLEHRYEVGGFSEDLFVVLAREAFLMLQYLKEQLHFYSYSELFRLIVLFFTENLDVSDCTDEMQARRKVAGVVGKINGRLKRFRGVPIKESTIVLSLIRRVRATRGCLFPPTQIFLEKMVI